MKLRGIRFGLIVVALGAGVGWLQFAGSSAEGAGRSVDAPAQQVESQSWLSEVYTIDRKYGSMMGPYGTRQLTLGAEGAPRELLWVTGYRAVMVGEDGETPVLQDFMCHSNLDLDPEAHRQALGSRLAFSPRLFTLSQGQLEIEFPPGFGIPVLSDEELSLTTQVLNHNVEGQSLSVRHLVTVDYVRQRDLRQPMKPLLPLGAYGLKLLEGDNAYYGVDRPESGDHGPGCLVGQSASDHSYDDGLGKSFTGHWVVEPGREVNRTLVTHLMQVPFETEVHYIAVHLHPFAESLELRDLTAGTTLFRSKARGFADRIGLAAVDYFSSAEGLTLYPDHEYEMVSVYNNTTEQPQDSMAVMYLYLLDRDFESRFDEPKWLSKLLH